MLYQDLHDRLITPLEMVKNSKLFVCIVLLFYQVLSVQILTLFTRQSLIAVTQKRY